ncbi:paired immunoglobulin-like type 2 receptor beta [Prionailurus iriomotensis]
MPHRKTISPKTAIMSTTPASATPTAAPTLRGEDAELPLSSTTLRSTVMVAAVVVPLVVAWAAEKTREFSRFSSGGLRLKQQKAGIFTDLSGGKYPVIEQWKDSSAQMTTITKGPTTTVTTTTRDMNMETMVKVALPIAVFKTAILGLVVYLWWKRSKGTGKQWGNSKQLRAVEEAGDGRREPRKSHPRASAPRGNMKQFTMQIHKYGVEVPEVGQKTEMKCRMTAASSMPPSPSPAPPCTPPKESPQETLYSIGKAQ